MIGLCPRGHKNKNITDHNLQLGVDRTLRGISDGCSRCRCFAIFVTHQIKWIHTHRGESRHTTCLRALMGRSRAGQITLVKSPSLAGNIGWLKTTLWKQVMEIE